MKKKSILYSTTRMTNIGDEVIYWGVRSLVDQLVGEHTAVLYNRHLSIRPNNRNFDNSVSETRHLSSWLDYAVIAGSPDWYGVRSNEFYRTVKRHNLRFSAIGIGSAELNPSIPSWIKELYKTNCDVVITRDTITQQYFKDFFPNAQSRNCPGVLHKMGERKPKTGKVKSICLNYQAGTRKITEATGGMKGMQLDVYEKLKDDYEVRILCNFIDDLDEAHRLFPDADIDYSADAHEYFECFSNYDFVIGPRVHGCLGALALGIPSVILDDGTNVRRKGVVEYVDILGKSYEIDDIKQYVAQIELSEESPRIIDWVEKKREQYLGELEGQLSLETRELGSDVKLVSPWYDYMIEFMVKLPEAIKQKLKK